jgi:aminoglycoside 6'-N-acetyltransferase I
MPITVRQGTFLDLAEWIRMRALLWPGCSVHDHRIDADKILKNTEEILYVADRGEAALAGFIEARLRPYADGCDTSPVGFVEGWFVDADVRRRGVGANLISAAETWAISRGCLEIASDTELHNEVSRAAHARLGFDEVEQVVRFRKRLSPK